MAPREGLPSCGSLAMLLSSAPSLVMQQSCAKCSGDQDVRSRWAPKRCNGMAATMAVEPLACASSSCASAQSRSESPSPPCTRGTLSAR